MKTIALIRNAYSFDFGGAERFPVHLANELAKNGFRPIIFSANKMTLKAGIKAGQQIVKSPWWSMQNFSGSRVLLFPIYLVWQKYLFWWYLWAGVKYKIDVFHPQSRDDFIAATFAAKILRKKVIWTDHADLKYIFANHKKWYKNPVGKLAYFASKYANSVTLVSQSEKELTEQVLGKKLPAKYCVIYNGVTDVYQPMTRNSKVINFVATSRLVEDKGIGELIEAFKLINNGKTLLKLYGDGPKADHFKSMVNNVKNIELAGHVDNITEVLSQADVFVHPSYHEGFSLSLVEAAMCSLPIVACRVGGNPEIVQDGVNGILIQPKNVEELTEAMRILMNSKKLRGEMGQASREIYLKQFQFDKIVKESFLPLYE
jgi:glycosyltransferase involved in cell wall biosynthesis